MGYYIDSEYTHPRLGQRREVHAAAPVATPAGRHAAAAASVRRFSYVLLATVLSTVIVIADRMVDAWTSGGLLLSLVVLWLAVFGGLVLFTRVSARLALWITAAWGDLTLRRQPYSADARQN